ncbi:MAG: MlaD family protein [Planctomycetota bacterium]
MRPRRRLGLIWLVPAVAVLLAGWLGYRAWSLRGVLITVQLPEGHGLASGDEVRYRGTPVGEVRRVDITDDLEGIVVTASLSAQADQRARGGSRFWVVRPQVSLGGVAGLETLVGPRYLEVRPGSGPRQRHFVGLGEPPPVETIEPGDLEIVLEAGQRGSLRPAAPVMYRQVQVGTVLSVGLTSDGGAVEARVHIDKAYAQLIRRQTRFWDIGGIEAQLGLRGLSVQVESLQTLLTGGVALATPPEADDVVRTGHRFALRAAPQAEWLEWEPMAVIGSAWLPPGAPLPSPLRAKAGWKQGRWLSRERQRQGWVLQTRQGLLGPADLLAPQEVDEEEPAVLEVAGRELTLGEEPVWRHEGMVVIAADVSDTTWPRGRRRRPQEAEDCLVVGDPAAVPLPLAAARLTVEDGVWLVDPAVPVDETWHGACVLSREDGYLVGLLLVEEDQPVRVALLPEE